ncbi:hypothetical protein [Neisseria sp.]|uniref:hypothetical protein n=1 Tax=Neisseria sp. TaxID=192066 RepID=UPI00359F36C2
MAGSQVSAAIGLLLKARAIPAAMAVSLWLVGFIFRSPKIARRFSRNTAKPPDKARCRHKGCVGKSKPERRRSIRSCLERPSECGFVEITGSGSEIGSLATAFLKTSFLKICFDIHQYQLRIIIINQ